MHANIIYTNNINGNHRRLSIAWKAKNELVCIIIMLIAHRLITSQTYS